MYLEIEKELKKRYPGNKGKINQCEECNRYVNITVVIGEASTRGSILREDSATTEVCKTCLQKALQLIEKEE